MLAIVIFYLKVKAQKSTIHKQYSQNQHKSLQHKLKLKNVFFLIAICSINSSKTIAAFD